MLGFFPDTQVFLVSGATDMRKSFRGLPAIVQNALGQNPLQGLYVFCNRRRNRLKILFFDRGGYWVCAKRLERGTFAWPNGGEVSLEMTPQELAMLLGSIDPGVTKHRSWYKCAANE